MVVEMDVQRGVLEAHTLDVLAQIEGFLRYVLRIQSELPKLADPAASTRAASIIAKSIATMIDDCNMLVKTLRAMQSECVSETLPEPRD